jgi:hypothetical protein
MSGWTIQELERIGEAQEMHVAGRRRDGSLRKSVIVWVVRSGDDLYTRSVNGPDAGWFRGTRERRDGQTAGPVDYDAADAGRRRYGSAEAHRRRREGRRYVRQRF